MSRAPRRVPVALGLTLALAACAGPRPSAVAHEDGWQVLVKSVRLPANQPWYSRFAEHTWIDLRRGDTDAWWRVEVLSRSSGVRVIELAPEGARADARWDRDVAVLASLRGERARVAGEALLAAALEHPDFGQLQTTEIDNGIFSATVSAPQREGYAAWPGPNSNTFVADLVAATPGLAVQLDHNAVGKDYARGLRAGRTTDGLGVELDSDYLGAGIGLRQGVELHLLGLTLGVAFWPPALELPFLPRVGIHPGWTSLDDTPPLREVPR
ncbi:MAG: DUF3750 domain-containing protein [Planctomycetes bacterium]|nr:DUF3750 domain-containing protein [Planctomycetota bacterium]